LPEKALQSFHKDREVFHGSERTNKVHGFRRNAENERRYQCRSHDCGRDSSETFAEFRRRHGKNKCERRKKMQVVIEIPKEVLYDTKQTIEQATDFAKRATALGFYKQYGVSVELCSQIAGITEKEFLSEAKRSFIG
jgi:hypothetical protein